MIGIATGNGNGSNSSNGWNRPISMNAYGGMTHWVGSWVDSGGGAQLWTHGGSGWSETAATYSGNFGGFSISGNTITYKVSMGSLGLGYGSVFAFDAYSSGGGNGDGAIDALANNNPAPRRTTGEPRTSRPARACSSTPCSSCRLRAPWRSSASPAWLPVAARPDSRRRHWI